MEKNTQPIHANQNDDGEAQQQRRGFNWSTGEVRGRKVKGRRLLGRADLVNGPLDAHQDPILGVGAPLMRKPPTDLQPGV